MIKIMAFFCLFAFVVVVVVFFPFLSNVVGVND